MSALVLTLSQVNYVNKGFWRNPTRAFFIFAFPLMFLVIFTALLGNFTVHIGSSSVKQSTYYVASMATYGVITACFANIAGAITLQRDQGILKRISGTPLPASSFLASQILHALLIAVLLVAITAVFGRAVYSAQIPTGLNLVHFLVMLVVGSAAFCAMGLAITGAVPNADAAQVVVNAVMLPLLFLSGIFIPFGNSTPSWVLWIARVFPVRHFAVGMEAGFLGTPFAWTDVAVVAAWGVVAMLLAVRFFKWVPKH